MSYFKTNDTLSVDTTVTLTQEEAHHARKVRRITAGETISLVDPSGTKGQGEVLEATEEQVVVKILTTEKPTTLPVTIVAAAVTKKPALEEIIKHATELGATEIALWQSEYSPITLEGIPSRFLRVAEEACKQSERPTPPIITYHHSLSTLLAEHLDVTLIVLDQHTNSPTALTATTPVMLLLGPEGGLSEKEFAAIPANAAHVSLSPFTLRAPTAALAGLAYINSVRK